MIKGRKIMEVEWPTHVWTEGVCEDGAAIMRDGVPIPIYAVLQVLNFSEEHDAAVKTARLEALEEAARNVEVMAELSRRVSGKGMRDDVGAALSSAAAAIRERAKLNMVQANASADEPPEQSTGQG